jgi:hypothetical protein
MPIPQGWDSSCLRGGGGGGRVFISRHFSPPPSLGVKSFPFHKNDIMNRRCPQNTLQIFIFIFGIFVGLFHGQTSLNYTGVVSYFLIKPIARELLNFK